MVPTKVTSMAVTKSLQLSGDEHCSVVLSFVEEGVSSLEPAEKLPAPVVVCDDMQSDGVTASGKGIVTTDAELVCMTLFLKTG